MYTKDALLKRRAELSAAKQALLAQQLRGEAAVTQGSTTIPRRPDQAQVPLSSIQERFWFLQQLDPHSVGYIGVQVYKLTCLFDVAAAMRTAREIVRRHEILRTTYQIVDGQVFQMPDPATPHTLTVPLIDLQALPAAERENAVRNILIEAQARPFALTREVPWDALLLRLNPAYHIVLLRIHHIIGDGWSVDTIVHRELLMLYRAYAAGQPSPLPDLPVQYADFAYWQRQQLQSDDFAQHVAYWKRCLADAPPVLALPTDHPRPPIQSYREATRRITFAPSLVTMFRELCQQEQITMFMALLAAFAAVLARYGDQKNLVIGTPIAGRDVSELEPLIGCFINTLALRIDLAGNPSFRELLRRVRAVCLEGFAHQQVPIEHVVAAVQPPRDSSRSVLFQAMFLLQNFPQYPPQPDQVEQLIGVQSGEKIAPVLGQGQCDLTMMLYDHDGLSGDLAYDATLFDGPTIERLLGHFVTLLAGVAAAPDQPLDAIALLDAEERRQLLEGWNTGSGSAPLGEQCIAPLFAAQAERAPDAVAVIFNRPTTRLKTGRQGDRETGSETGTQSSVLSPEHLTYRELDTRSNQLAQHLRGLGVGPEVLVGICIERSPEQIVGMLGVFKAGGAYMPLDPGYPQERLAFMLADARPAVLLTQRSIYDLRFTIYDLPGEKSAAAHEQPSVLCLDADWSLIASLPALAPAAVASARNLAYVIYTSGATGRPKGVMVEQQVLTGFSQAIAQTYALTPADRVLQFASASFDASVEEIFPCLLSGATLVLRTDTMLDTPTTFLKACRDWSLSVLDLPTAYWHELAAHLSVAALPPCVRLVIIGGERALPERLADWRRAPTRARLVNTYGPTEATVVTTAHEVAPAPPADAAPRELPIGRAIAGARIYVLDRHMQPTPIGLPGELYVGGARLARGYLDRPKLTAERFVPNPFEQGVGGWGLGVGDTENRSDSHHSAFCILHSAFGTRLYRTGDWVRTLLDGTVEFLGRLDQQVKLRGYRIEMGEIEATLAQHPGVHTCAVVAREDTPGAVRLVGYVVPTTDQRPTTNDQVAEHSSSVVHRSSFIDALRVFLRTQLPDYMLPSAFVLLDALPLTSSSKLDRRALPDPGAATSTEHQYIAPRTPVEQELAAIWAAVLKRESVGIYHNFFELGGHSLLASQIVYRLNAAFQVDLPLRRLFQEPTIAQLALTIEELWLDEIEALDEEHVLQLSDDGDLFG